MTIQYPHLSPEVPSLGALSPSDFVALVNQTLEYAYPVVEIKGELSNFRISKNRWVYFDLKDEQAKVSFFGTVYSLPGPLEDGMVLKVTAQPRLSPQYGFSLNVQSIALSGEGTIKRAFDLLLKKLSAEGLFAPERKRFLPYPPVRIGLITSSESAAYADFVKVTSARWSGLEITLADVAVQGEAAAGQVAKAVEYFNALGEPPEVLVIIRGGGSADDLQTFNTELVTRAVAASRIPTLVAIGHEIDISLAELASDVRASTPSNAAELLVPDKAHVYSELKLIKTNLAKHLSQVLSNDKKDLALKQNLLAESIKRIAMVQRQELQYAWSMLSALSPENILRRGYAIVKSGGKVIRTSKSVIRGSALEIRLAEGNIKAEVQ